MTSRLSDDVASRFGLFLCVECGKCSAVCPMNELFEDYRYEVSPRGLIERALLGLSFEGDADVWSCLTCDLCTEQCPQGVQVRDFVVAVRDGILEAGRDEHAAFCRVCKTYLGSQHTEAHLEKVMGDDDPRLLYLCPRCRRYDVGRKMRALVPGARVVREDER